MSEIVVHKSIVEKKVVRGTSLVKVSLGGGDLARYDTWEQELHVSSTSAPCPDEAKDLELQLKKRKRITPPRKAKQRGANGVFSDGSDDDGETAGYRSSTRLPVTEAALFPRKSVKLSDKRQRHPARGSAIVKHSSTIIDFEKKLASIPGPPVTLVNEIDGTSPPYEFTFINEMVLSPMVKAFGGEDLIWGCECEGACDEEPALCQCYTDKLHDVNGVLQKVVRSHYSEDQFVRHDNQKFIFECNKDCSCWPDCSNIVVQKGRKVPIEIFKTEKKGWGIRCPEALKPGVFIDLYLGEILHPDEASQRDGNVALSYLFNLDKASKKTDLEKANERAMLEKMTAKQRKAHKARDIYFTVDGRYMGGITRFINHSCDANTSVYAVQTSRRDNKVYDLAFFTLEEIPAYTELTFDYSGVAHPKGGKKAIEEKKLSNPCFCESENCKGYLW